MFSCFTFKLKMLHIFWEILRSRVAAPPPALALMFSEVYVWSGLAIIYYRPSSGFVPQMGQSC